MSRPQVRVYDKTGTDQLATLQRATGVVWQHPLAGSDSSAGTLSFSIKARDPKAVHVQPHRIVKAYWHGGIRCGFRIRYIKRVRVGREWRLDVVALQIRTMMGDGVALPEYGLRPGSGETRTFGHMSEDGPWRDPAEWTPAWTRPYLEWQADAAAAHYGLVGWPDPGATRLFVAGPADPQPTYKAWGREEFSTDVDEDGILFIACDDTTDVWLDGQLLNSLTAESSVAAMRTTFQIDGVKTAPGNHVIAWEQRNDHTPPDEVQVGEFMWSYIRTGQGGVLGAVIAHSTAAAIVRSDLTPGEPGWRKAQVVKKLWEEAVAAGFRGPTALTLGFTDTHDSAGQPWTDEPLPYVVRTESDFLDRIIDALFNPTINWDVDAATMTLQAWNRRGADRTGGTNPLTLRLARDLAAISIEEVYDVATRLYGRTAQGLAVVRDDAAASTEAGGIVAAGVSLGSAGSTATAEAVMDAHLSSLAYPIVEVTAELATTGRPVPYVDAELGDTGRCPDGDDGFIPVRLDSFTVDASGPVVRAYPTISFDRSVTL